MSHLQYYAYKGVGERNLKRNGYNQAVRIGDRIECSGQGTPIHSCSYSLAQAPHNHKTASS